MLPLLLHHASGHDRLASPARTRFGVEGGAVGRPQPATPRTTISAATDRALEESPGEMIADALPSDLNIWRRSQNPVVQPTRNRCLDGHLVNRVESGRFCTLFGLSGRAVMPYHGQTDRGGGGFGRHVAGR